VDQVELLRRLGFRSVQGHVFAPPTPLDEMSLWTRLPTSVPLGPTAPEDSAAPPAGQ
jgi:hypothetical protein